MSLCFCFMLCPLFLLNSCFCYVVYISLRFLSSLIASFSHSHVHFDFVFGNIHFYVMYCMYLFIFYRYSFLFFCFQIIVCIFLHFFLSLYAYFFILFTSNCDCVFCHLLCYFHYYVKLQDKTRKWNITIHLKKIK